MLKSKNSDHSCYFRKLRQLRTITHYNLDAIISVDSSVNSRKGVHFSQ